MLSFVKNWLGPRANPIGVDFGSDSIKLAQVAFSGNEWRLIAAATADVPSHVRHDAAARMSFFIQSTRELLVQGGFSGRQAVLALPAASMFIQHLRLPKMDEDALKKAIPWEARGKLPIDPMHALIRHHVAGEIYQEQEARHEVIVMAAGRELVNQFLATATKARLDVVGMHVEPRAIVDCFARIYRRKTDGEVINCFVDIGCSGTRAIIASGAHILFARSIPIGGDHFARAVATAMNTRQEDAKLLRLRLCNLQPSPGEMQQKQEVRAPEPEGADNGFAVLDAALSAARKRDTEPHAAAGTATAVVEPAQATPAPAGELTQARIVEEACREPLDRLIDELNMCRRYYEATFPNRPVDRLVFVGGEAKHRAICQYIAQGLSLAAQVGDPLVRMGRVSDIGIESGIDRRQPQPNWAVAIGLSMGPTGSGEITA
jgi:type IV pilus assembly protein PilM